jgi:MoaA/NifB/PqqE/SkfB family radical SAM enzyme
VILKQLPWQKKAANNAMESYPRFRHEQAQAHRLNYLFWECTRRCNLRCLHCGSDCAAGSAYRDMPFGDFLRSILPLKTAYPRDSITVAVTGGEPLLRDDIFECGLALRQNGFRWGIVTNGYAYTPEVHGRLLGAGMGSVTVSLDGLEDTHNWLRGDSESFERAVNAVKLITATERLRSDVVTCVNRNNIDQLDAIKALLIRLKVKTWRLFTINPMHSWNEKQDDIMTCLAFGRSAG